MEFLETALVFLLCSVLVWITLRAKPNSNLASTRVIYWKEIPGSRNERPGEQHGEGSKSLEGYMIELVILWETVTQTHAVDLRTIHLGDKRVIQ